MTRQKKLCYEDLIECNRNTLPLIKSYETTETAAGPAKIKGIFHFQMAQYKNKEVKYSLKLKILSRILARWAPREIVSSSTVFGMMRDEGTLWEPVWLNADLLHLHFVIEGTLKYALWKNHPRLHGELNTLILLWFSKCLKYKILCLSINW